MVDVTIIVDSVVREFQPLFTAGLRRQDAARLLDRLIVASKQALNLCVFITIDDQDAINELQQRGAYQQRHDDDLVRAACFPGLAPGFGANRRMQNGFKIQSCGVIGKYQPAHDTAIEISCRVNDFVAKSRANFEECGRAGCYNFPGDDVGIDDGYA